MKNITWYLKYFMWILVLLFVVSCSDDNDVKPVFPELQKISGEVDQTIDLEFEANTDWKLTSSSLWCQFVVNNETVNSCSGTSGKQTVTVKILDQASELNKSYKAEITLWMAGSQAVVYEVTRPVIGYEFVITDKNGNSYSKEDFLILPYTQGEYTIKANFDWQCAEWPEWIEFNKISGLAGESKTIITTIGKAHTIKPATGNFTFINEAGEQVLVMKAKYDGIPEDRIEFSTGNNKYNWAFSLDGQKYSSSGVSSTTWLDAPLPLTAMAKNDEYKIILLESTTTDTYTHVGTSSWYTVTDRGAGTIHITAEETTSEDPRSGSLLIFPTAAYNKIGDANFNETVLPNGKVAAAYTQYQAIVFSQDGIPFGFKIYDINQNRLIATSLLEEMSETDLMNQYNTINVYKLILHKAYDELTVYSNGANYTPVEIVGPKPTDWKNTTTSFGYGNNFKILNTPATASDALTLKINDAYGNLHGVLILYVQ